MAEGFPEGHMGASQKPLKREMHLQKLLSLSRGAGARGMGNSGAVEEPASPGH